jgi:hypothetical protein
MNPYFAELYSEAMTQASVSVSVDLCLLDAVVSICSRILYPMVPLCLVCLQNTIPAFTQQAAGGSESCALQLWPALRHVPKVPSCPSKPASSNVPADDEADESTQSVLSERRGWLAHAFSWWTRSGGSLEVPPTNACVGVLV